MRTVHWNKLAWFDYHENIDYLLKEWSEKEAQHFIDEVYEIEFILSQGNVDFQETDRKDIKRCVIFKQISLLYKVNDEFNVELLRFWNNNQDIKKLRF
jgi:hypothetical protein